MSSSLSLSIIIPAGNNTGSLALSLIELDYVLDKSRLRSFEVIVVGSNNHEGAVKHLGKFLKYLRFYNDGEIWSKIRGKKVLILTPAFFGSSCEEENLVSAYMDMVLPFVKKKLKAAVLVPKQSSFLDKVLSGATKTLTQLLRLGRDFEMPVGAVAFYTSPPPPLLLEKIKSILPFKMALSALLLGFKVDIIEEEKGDLRCTMIDYFSSWKDLVIMKFRRWG